MDESNFLSFEIYYSGGNQTDTDYVYDNVTTLCPREEVGLQTFHGVLHSMLYCFIFVLGVVMNCLMIAVLLRRRSLGITEIYLLHLAMADLMLLLTFPFDVANSTTGWMFGAFLCKLVGLMKKLNLFCGSFLLACIGFDRYLAIVHAIPHMQNRRRRTVHLTCISLWLVCLGLSIPNTVFLTMREDTNTSVPDCSYNKYGINTHNWVLTIRTFDHVSFFLPLAVMSYCYTAVVITLCKSRRSQAKQGAIRVALLVTLIFCFCWLPYNVTLLIKTLTDLQVILHESCGSYDLLHSVLDVTETLGLSHCCLNPFLYAFLGVKFRNELLELLCKLGCGHVCMPFIRAQGQGRPSISDAGTTGSNIFIK